jgi:SAM-dependent methyltransferase
VKYTFTPVHDCEMCGSARHRILGQRLNQSQGRNPRAVGGIAVTVKRCLDCGLIYSDPRPAPEKLTDHYDMPPAEYWTDDHRFHEPDRLFFLPQITTAKRLTTGRRALDIGAGLGFAMKAMAAEFDVYGLEPSEPFRTQAIASGIAPDRILPAAAEDAEFGPEFDFVTFGAVLEHLQRPALAIERALTWLKPGGVMHIEVPSSDYLMSKVTNLYFRLRGVNAVTNLSPMHSPFHLYEFALTSFEKHAARAGYAIAEHTVDVCGILHFPAAMKPPLDWYMARTGTGMQLTVWLRKA